MTTQIIGCAELYGRLRTVINRHGPRTRTSPGNTSTCAYVTDDGQPASLHGHVLHDLGANVGILGTDALNVAPADQAYAAAGFTLTAKAERLAVVSCDFEESWPWADAVDVAARFAHQLDDTRADRRAGYVALLGVLRHVANTYPVPGLPGWSPEDTPLFITGYPTTLLGYAAADLHVDAVAASRLGENRAVDLFRVLGWQLSPRAEALADLVQHHEARGESWPDAVAIADAADLGNAARHDVST
jgi:hypothetical protein